MKNILIGIYNEIYEISKYVSKHPGEGIKFVSLLDYNRKESTEDFERQHMTDEADIILESARNDGFDEESGIYYVCPYFFKKRIPKYFIFSNDDPYATSFMKDKPINTFILRRSNSDLKNSLSITFKDDEEEINQLKIRKLEDCWYTIWEDEEGESIDIYKDTIEEIIDEVMINNGFKNANKK